MKSNLSNQTRLRLGCSMLAICTLGVGMLPSLAAAQEEPKAETVVVTGQRAQLRSAQAIKKNAEVVVDSITATDIGALPDRSVSEALQRIAGLQLQRTNENRDPGRLAAEGGSVNIRGLAWVRSETNGRDIFSAKNGRGLSFEDVSADMLAGVDVYKNPTADMIEGGIGGTVNLRTRLPFDSKKDLFAFTFDGNYGDIDGKTRYSGSAVASKRFDIGSAGELGVLINYSRGDVGNRSDALNLDRYSLVDIDSTAAVNNKMIPNGLSWKAIEWNQLRTSLAGAIQWKSSDKFLLTMQAMESKVDADNTEYGIFAYNILDRIDSSYKYNAANVFTGGTIQQAVYDTDTRYGEDHKKTTEFSIGFRANPTENWEITGDVQEVKSTADILSMTAYTQLEDQPTINLVADGGVPSVVIATPNSTLNKARYYWAAAMDHIEENEGEQLSARLDAKFTFSNQDGWLKSFKFGARSTDKDYITRQSGWNWGLLSHQYWGGGPPVYVTSTNANMVNMYDYGSNFFRGKANVPGNAWFPDPSVVNQGTAHAYSLLQGTQSAGWGWSPLSRNWDNYAPAGDNATAGVNDQTEQTSAFYGHLRFGHQMPVGELDGSIGIRRVTTKVTSSGIMTVTPLQNPTCTAAPAQCVYLNDYAVFSAGNGRVGNIVTDEYSENLPALNLRYKLNDQLQFRFAASKAMVRPDLSQMTPYTNLSGSFNGDGSPIIGANGQPAPYTGIGGNPNLRPIKANQYDITAEWYFAPTGSLTLAVFKKDITDYIFNGTSRETITRNGKTLTFDVTRQLNGGKGTVDGFELSYQQFYDFLPGIWSGLGIQANYTKINSSGGQNTAVNVFDPAQRDAALNTSLPLEGMSPTSYNFAVMYEKYGISARVAYNWRDEYLLTTSGANINRPVWSDDEGQLDASIFYTLNDKLKIGLQATNLDGEATVLKVSSFLENVDLKQNYSWVTTDRRVALVLRAAF